MKYKNENFINRNFYPFNKNKSFRVSFMEKYNKKVNEGIDFRRATSTCVLNTDGEKPLIIFIKSPKKTNTLFEKKMLENNNNILNYMSDGGLKQKNKKFYNLLSKYPSNYKYYSPIKQKKEILNELKNKKYNSLTFSRKKLHKNQTTIDSPKDNEESNNHYKTARDKFIKTNLFTKIKHNQEFKNEKNKINIKNKIIDKNYKNSLIKNLIKNFKIINLPKEKTIPVSILNERKKEFLEKNGIDISKLSTPKGSIKENIEEEKNNNKKDELYKYIKNKNLLKIKSNNEINPYEEKGRRIKPIIDQFEYIRKILNAHKKLPYSSIKLNNFFKNNNKNNNIDLNNNKRNIQNKNYIKNNDKINYNDEENSKNEKLNTKSTEETNDEYPFSHKRSHRNAEELKIFRKLKRIKERKKSKENELEKKKKLYIRFQNLCKLNLENLNNERINKNIKNINLKNNKRRKEINKYNIGNEISKSSSTLIEPNDYYIALYQSQQVITNANIDINNKIFQNPSLLHNLIDNKMNLNNNIMNNIYNDKKNDDIYKTNKINTFIKKIKLIFVRKIFISLFHYFLAIKLFIAIIKQYPFNKLYLFYINNKENINPENKNINKVNITYLVEVLSVVFKIKTFEKLFNYCQEKEMKIKKEIFEKVFKILIKPHIKNIFHILKNIDIKKIKDLDKKIINNNINEMNKNENEKNDNINKNINKIIKNEIEKNKDLIDEDDKIDNDKKINENKKIEKHKENNDDMKIDDKIEDNKDNNIVNININKEEKKNNNNLSNINEDEKNENDISDEKDSIKDIEWNYVCPNNINELKKEKNLNNNINDVDIKKNNNINEQKESNKNKIDYEENFNNIKSCLDQSDLLNDSQTDEEKNKDNLDVLIDNEIQINDKNDKNMNVKKEKLIDLGENKINDNNINKNKEKEKEFLSKSIKSINNPNKFADDLTGKIVKDICDSEITSPEKKLIPNKLFKNEINNNNENDSKNGSILGLGLMNNNMLSDDDSNLFLENSLMFSSSTYSLFNKTVKDKKAENSINLYMDKIAPKLIRLIYKELIEKHKRIYENISTPLINHSEKIMISLSLNDEKMLKDNYKLKIFKESIEDIIDKKNILKKFEKINNEIRIKDNISSDNYYDNILNECILDTTIELINKQRIYYNEGEPLLWGEPRNDPIKYDFRSDPKKFSIYICKSLVKLLKRKLGIIQEKNSINYDNINKEKEKKLNNMIKEQAFELDKEWNNLEIEETKAKLDAEDYILGMILRENIEILEHVQLNRRRPDLYNNRSIYACPEMPKLEFQKKENEGYFEDLDNDLINFQ